MTNYSAFESMAPGVYVIEEPGVPGIQNVSISTPGFIGVAEDVYETPAGGSTPVQVEQNVPGQAVLITGFAQYQKYFGGFLYGRYLAYAVYTYFQQGGNKCYISRAVPESGAAASVTTARSTGIIDGVTISATSAGKWGNNLSVEVDAYLGSTTKFNITVYFTDPNDANASPKQVEKFYAVSGGEDGNIAQVAKNVKLSSVYIRLDSDDFTKAKLSAKPSTALSGGDDTPYDFFGLASEVRGLQVFVKQEDARVLALPDLVSPDLHDMSSGDPFSTILAESYDKFGAFLNKYKNRFGLVDPPAGLDTSDIATFRGNLEASSYYSLYYPWVEMLNPIGDGTVNTPPSGGIAGLIVAADEAVGPWQSPAGIAHGQLTLAFKPAQIITAEEQGPLNEWPSNINVIRQFPSPTGVYAWGARTLTADPTTTYIAVRRLLLEIEISLKTSLKFAVFLPNNVELWTLLNRDITEYLTGLFHQGALKGSTVAEAFHVTVDASNNPPSLQEQGILAVSVGVAPVDPAEFIVITVFQMLDNGTGS